MAEQVRITPQGPFDLTASKRFIAGFPPAGQPTTGRDDLDLVLLTDDWGAALVRMHQTPELVIGEVVDGEVDHDVLRTQLTRVLSLDVDGSGFSDVVDGDAVLGGVATLFQGLRPALFPTPFEAACWSVLSQRTRMSQAAAVRARLVTAHGRELTDGARSHHAFPTPQALLEVEQLDGAAATKVERLHAVASAALDGALDPARLRALPVEKALDALQGISGIGPFGAELILVRGAGAPDVFPSHERRLHQAMAELYDLDDPTVDELETTADAWRPYRSWAALLLRAWWEQRHS